MATQSPGDSTLTATTQRGAVGTTSLVVCSLEPWGEVRRRMRILVDELVDLDPLLQVLYVTPAFDVPHQLRQGSVHGLTGPRLERVHPRIHVLRPRKWLPRVIGPFADRALERQILKAAFHLGLHDPLLWVNDAAYAEFSVRSGWPSLYDITDDWLLMPLPPRQRDRLAANEKLLLQNSGAVVVCSPDLERTRGRDRAVELIPNGVDVELFRTPQRRPPTLPPAPVALYVGTLHAERRLDVPLLLDLAGSLPEVNVALLGPNHLPAETTAELDRVPNIHLLGARPYDQVPAYMQHADVVIIPHLVNPFTESLDPIKAYECVAAGRPTVATPVAGFRQLGPPVIIADRHDFVRATADALAEAVPPGQPTGFEDAPVPSWRQRAEAMASVMEQVRTAGAQP